MNDFMVNTVLGPVAAARLGITLMHEHLIGDWEAKPNMEQQRNRYLQEDVIAAVAPHLIALKRAGASTLVDCNPHGFGRDVELYRALAEVSGLNIIVSTGAFACGFPKYIPPELIALSEADIADIWVAEFEYGIEGANIKPGIIKLALDNGPLTPAELKLLKAAARVSLRTGMPVMCHILPSVKAVETARLVQAAGLPLNRLIWAHADYQANQDVMLNLARQGVWLEVDSGWKGIEHRVHVIKSLVDAGVADRILTSQDFCNHYVVGTGVNIFPFDQLLQQLVPFAKNQGLDDNVLDLILRRNVVSVFTGCSAQ